VGPPPRIAGGGWTSLPWDDSLNHTNVLPPPIRKQQTPKTTFIMTLRKSFWILWGFRNLKWMFFFLPYSNICINLFPNGQNIYRAISPCLRFFGKCRKMTKVSDSTNDKIWDNMSIRSSSTWRKLLSPHLKVFTPINVLLLLHHETWLTKEPHIFSSFIPRWVSQVDRGENRGESEGT
jgi:hypothetical protein